MHWKCKFCFCSFLSTLVEKNTYLNKQQAEEKPKLTLNWNQNNWIWKFIKNGEKFSTFETNSYKKP